MTRESVESELVFAGFLVFHCPLKSDSKAAIDMLNKSAHRVIMITGDNPLTACHVAKELDIVEQDVLILDKEEDDDDGNTLAWRTIDDTKRIPVEINDLAGIDVASTKDYDLCLTGGAMRLIQHSPLMNDLLSRVWVYARVSPSQKVSLHTRMPVLFQGMAVHKTQRDRLITMNRMDLPR